jgi:hypothetical protein
MNYSKLREVCLLLACITLFQLFCFNSGFAQSRSSGRMVVPIGWENHDSIRYSPFGLYYYPPLTLNGQANRVMDTIMANFAGEFGYIRYENPLVGGRYNGAVSLTSGGFDQPLLEMRNVKQRVFYAEPYPDNHNGWLVYDYGYRWRYIDSTAAYHNNRYDSNDISTYMEFPANRDSVVKTFSTLRYGAAQSPCYGIEGKTVLGYSDSRIADALFSTYSKYPFGTIKPGASVATSDTARAFAAILEFNLDTASIITDSSRGLATDNLPLARLQIAFKKAGQSVLPYVPFKTIADTVTNPGWFIAVDTFITRAVYRSLTDSWRSEDVLNGGTTHAHSWKFKQLHVQLKVTGSMADLIAQCVPNPKGPYGTSGDSAAIGHRVHQDSIVVSDVADANEIQANNLAEIEVLSTFRCPMRVRSLCWQDTVADKYFYRKRLNDSTTHSLKADGTLGGYDDSLISILHRVDSLVPTGVTREFFMEDYDDALTYTSASAMGLEDYLASRYGRLHVHIHEQDEGVWMEQYRRERMSHDGVPPSLFENQTTTLYTNTSSVFPVDYMYYAYTANAADTSTFPSSNDHLFNLTVSRPSGSKALASYTQYTNYCAGFYPLFAQGFRKSSLIALRHPNNKRFATEVQTPWGDISVNPTPDYLQDGQAIGTPEQISAQMFGALANGISTFTSAEAMAFGNGPTDVANDQHVTISVGLITSPINSPAYFDSIFAHDYNWGYFHYKDRIPWRTDNIDSTSPQKYYLGFSNTWRAHLQVLRRINQLYPQSSPRSFTHFKWLDAYSYHLTYSSTSASPPTFDSLSRANGFLKLSQAAQVKRYARGSGGEFIDSLDGSSHLVIDSLSSSFVELGMFIDSISSSSKNYASLIVNTRTFPGNDPTDVNYYNTGLPLADQFHSTLGDIDARKVYMKIDTSKLDVTSRSDYYVVRDLWHPDTTWLVKADSNFAIYLKPGDAKFLYFEKAYSILVSKTGATGAQEFAFNNGRRVAERKRGTQTVTTYTRGHKLYVSYAAKGKAFGGYAEHSDQDNIATGNEEALDTVRYCSRPSIIVGSNDSSVAIAYFVKVSSDSGYIRIAYQNGPGATWKFANFTGESFADSSTDLHQVTPVVTQGNNKNYVVLATNRTGHSAPYTVVGFRFKYESDNTLHLQSNSTVLYTDATKECLFPTVASRPLDSNDVYITRAFGRRRT